MAMVDAKLQRIVIGQLELIYSLSPKWKSPSIAAPF